MSDIYEHGDHKPDDDLEIVECFIGNYRFGVQRDHVVDSGTWHPNYLGPTDCEDKAVLGTMMYGGEPIFTIDLQRLFSLESSSKPSTAPLYMVVKHDGILFAILLDGFLGLCQVPLKCLRSFTSLYVLGVRWLSGLAIFDDYLVLMVDLEALSSMLSTLGDKSHAETVSHFAPEQLPDFAM